MDVVVVGSCNTDLVSYAPCMPKPGETVHGSKFTVSFGGKGANQCIMSSRLGAKTAMVAKLGDDSFGNSYLENLRNNNINTDHVHQTSEAASGVATISVNGEGQNSIIIIAGANYLLSKADIAASEDLIRTSKVLLCQLEVRPSVTLSALRLAKKHGVLSILNPAPAQQSLDPEIYQLADVFCPNESEAEILSGLSVKNVDEAMAALEVFLDRGCKTAIITLGEMGAVFASKEDSTPVYVSAKKVNPVDTTGAGDAFIGGLAYYLGLTNMSFKEAICRAGKIAAISVQACGAQNSYPARKDLPSELFH